MLQKESVHLLLLVLAVGDLMLELGLSFGEGFEVFLVDLSQTHLNYALYTNLKNQQHCLSLRGKTLDVLISSRDSPELPMKDPFVLLSLSKFTNSLYYGETVYILYIL